MFLRHRIRVAVFGSRASVLGFELRVLELGF